MDAETGNADLQKSEGLSTPQVLSAVDAVHAKTSPRMTVHDAIEEICATGSGAWALRSVSALVVVNSISAIQMVINTYFTGCVGQSFEISSNELAHIGGATCFGYFIGSLVLSPYADVYGRRLLLMWSTGGIAFFGLLTCAAPTFELFLAGRFFCGFSAGPFMTATAFATECVALNYRGALSNYVTGVSWALGTTLTNVVAWLIIPDYGWQAYAIAMYIPVVFNIWQLYMLVESPRWLVSQGRMDEALEALDYMAKCNGTVLPCSGLIASPLSPMTGHELTPLASTNSSSTTFCTPYRILVEETQMVLLLALTVLWTTSEFAYFALVFFDTDLMGVKSGLGTCQFDYGFNMIVGSSEIVGAFLVMPLLDRPDYSPWLSGRVGTQTASLVVALLGLVLTIQHVDPLVVWAYTSRGLMNGIIGVQMIQAAELFNAQCRATGVGFLCAAAMLASSSAPYLVFSSYSQETIGSGIACAIVIAITMLFLIPETAQEELDNTLYGVYA